LLCAAGSATAQPFGPEFDNGFEVDLEGWNDYTGDITRVASGTNGIASAEGAWHATAVGSVYTGWGAYSSEWPTGGYCTELDFYLDVTSGAANDTRFDWISSINGSDGNHQRGFVFNGGFYDESDTTGPGAGTDRFVISASNNAFRSDSYPKNPGRDPIAISETGWYTFQHCFRNDGGVLAVDLNLWQVSSDSLVKSWTLSDATDTIPAEVGGNRYGWLAANEFDFLAVDNSYRSGPSTSDDSPEPATWLLLACTGAVGAWVRRKREK
jgi:hypothetical protein